MRRPRSRAALALLAAWAGLTDAGDVEAVYITDMTVYTALAPCVQSALNYNVQYLTDDQCPSAAALLSSCACSKLYASVTGALSSSVKYSCGIGTNNQASATAVLSAYCDQNTDFAFPTPSIVVQAYPTDIGEMSYIAPCAASMISYAIMAQTYSACPTDAGSLNTCVCQNSQISATISQSINTEVKSSCSNTMDVSTAQAFFAAYCNLNSGVSSFPTPTKPPGDMTYWMSDMPAYSSLAPCAASAVSYAAQNSEYCPTIGPQAMASCACLKDGMPSMISSMIKSGVSYSCSDIEDVTSANQVYNQYCSAARGEIKVAVSNSVADATPTGPPATAAGGATTGPKQTSPSGGGKGGSGSGNGSANSSGGGSGSAKDTGANPNKTAIIAGAAIGVVGGLGIIGLAIVLIMRNAKKKRQSAKPESLQTLNNDGTDPHGFDKPELAGRPVTSHSVAPPGSPSPSMMKYGASPIASTVSPVSAHNSAFPPPGTPELSGQNNYPPMPQFNNSMPHKAELQGQMYNANGQFPSHHAELQGGQTYANVPPHNRAEMYAGNAPAPQQQQQQRPELYGQMYAMRIPQQGPYGQPMHEFPGNHPVHQAGSTPVPQRAELQGMGWQSGPVVAQYAELDGGYSRGMEPHAR